MFDISIYQYYKQSTQPRVHERIENTMFASKARDRAKQAKLDAILTRISAWEATRPIAPFDQKPRYRTSSERGMFFGSFVPLALMGMLVGLAVFATAPTPIHSTHIWLASAVVWMPFVFGLGIPIVVGLIVDIVSLPIHWFNLRAWNKYEEQYNDWRRTGREEFASHLDLWEVRKRVERY